MATGGHGQAGAAAPGEGTRLRGLLRFEQGAEAGVAAALARARGAVPVAGGNAGEPGAGRVQHRRAALAAEQVALRATRMVIFIFLD